MAKKRNGKIKKTQFFALIGLLLAVAAIVVYLIMDVVFIADEGAAFTGVDVLFGCSGKALMVTIEYLVINFVLLIAFIILILAAIFPVIMPSKTNCLIAAIGFIVVTAAIFMLPLYLQLGFPENGVLDLSNKLAEATGGKLAIDLKIGSIVAGILTGAGAVVNILGYVSKK